jgi:uncharacterized protein
MPHFIIRAEDKPDHLPLRLQQRPAHLDYVRALGARLLLAGPTLDADGNPNGSLLIIDCESITQAQSWAAGDPYAKAGLFANASVTPFRKSLPEAQ